MPAAVIEPFFDTSGIAVADTVSNAFKSKFDLILAQKKAQDNYTETQLNVDINNLKNLFSRYVKSGGVANAMMQPKADGSPPTAADNTVAGAINTINLKLDEYKRTVIEPLRSLRREIIVSTDVNQLSTNITKQINVNQELEKQIKEENDNLSTAFTRDTMLETKDDVVSYRQTWGFLQRPLRRSSIPLLIMFGLIFLVISITGIFAMFVPTTGGYGAANSGTNSGYSGFRSMAGTLGTVFKALVGIIPAHAAAAHVVA
jgi:hypothetical protein